MGPKPGHAAPRETFHGKSRRGDGRVFMFFGTDLTASVAQNRHVRVTRA